MSASKPSYTLHPIYGMPTVEVRRDGQAVGFLFGPTASDHSWEVVPRHGRLDGLPDGDRGYVARRFVTRARAEAFLGIFTPVEALTPAVAA